MISSGAKGGGRATAVDDTTSDVVTAGTKMRGGPADIDRAAEVIGIRGRTRDREVQRDSSGEGDTAEMIIAAGRTG